MFCSSKMRTVKGKVVGDEAVIGELVRYKIGGDYARRARIALLDDNLCDFDMLFEMSQEFMGFVRLGEYDKNIAEMAEELRFVGLFCDDEKKIRDSINETMIILPKKSRAILAPDISALTNFENALFSDRKYEEELACNRCGFSVNTKRFK